MVVKIAPGSPLRRPLISFPRTVMLSTFVGGLIFCTLDTKVENGSSVPEAM